MTNVYLHLNINEHGDIDLDNHNNPNTKLFVSKDNINKLLMLADRMEQHHNIIRDWVAKQEIDF